MSDTARKPIFKRSASDLSTRESSPEFGDNTAFVKRNRKTGRPLRSTAGKRTSLPALYIASEIAIEQDGVDESSDSPEYSGEGVKSKTWGNKRRRYSPPPPELSPEPEEPTELQASETLDTPGAVRPREISLTFNVPRGHEGAFVVKLDLPSMLSIDGVTSTLCKPLLTALPKVPSYHRQRQSGTSCRNKNSTKSVNKSKVGFLDLPAELRNTIYRQTFISDQPVDFRWHTNFSHRGAFLSTCRTVYEEGTQILYGDNEFKLARDGRPRGTFWGDWTEVGWKDVRRFLSIIGQHNISKLRKLSITFEDPAPRDHYNPHFTNDDHLMECMRLLAYYGKLDTLSLSFHGKNMVKKNDTRFLYNLEALKADQCKVVSDPSVHIRSSSAYAHYCRSGNIAQGLDKQIISRIERKNKLYEIED